MSLTKSVRILLLGDSGVGKTSLIMSLISEEFLEQADLPARVEDITIPPDVTPERVPTHIVDYSSREQTNEQRDHEIKKASVIIVVYALNDPETWKRVASLWLPTIRSVIGEDGGNRKKPIILAGNKDDLPSVVTQEDVMGLMELYVDIDSCVHCSAKSLKNISECFYYAQKSVIHPTAPIYNVDEKELSPECRRALVRIFRIVDLDGDGALSDSELNLFQRQCFAAPLQPQSLDDVKAVIRRYVPDGGISPEGGGMTLAGFLFLHKLFVQRGRQETTWTVLRKFGYTDDFQFSKDYLRPALFAKHGVELSSEGYQFLYQLFRKADRDADGHLSPAEQANLFSALCPSAPWASANIRNQVETDARGWISLRGFLAAWTLMAALDPGQLFEYLAYLGYNYEHDNQYSAITVLGPSSTAMSNGHLNAAGSAARLQQSVYHCQVIGAKGVGKTTFLQGLLGRSHRYVCTLDPAHLPSYTINAVQVHGLNKYLILHEIDVGLTDALTLGELRRCDVVVLMFDVTDPKSFDYIARLYVKHFALNQTPVMIVAAKAEQPAVSQEYALQPASFCARHRLPPLQPFYCVEHISTDVYSKLTNMAAFPRQTWWQAADSMVDRLRQLVSSDQQRQSTSSDRISLPAWTRVAVVSGVGVVTAFVLYRWWIRRGSTNGIHAALPIRRQAVW